MGKGGEGGGRGGRGRGAGVGLQAQSWSLGFTRPGAQMLMHRMVEIDWVGGES